MKFMGQMVQGIGAYDAGKYTRNVMQTNATNTQRDGSMQAEDIRHASRVQMGEQVASLGSNGFQAGSGSALDALRESFLNREVAIARVRRTADSQAQAYRSQGSLAYAQGFNQMSGSFLSGVGDLMKDAAKGAAGGG